MCNLYRLRVQRWELASYLAAYDDWRRDPEKDYTAPGKEGAIVRMQDGRRILTTAKWGYPTRRPRKRPAKEGELPWLYDWWTNARNLDGNLWRWSVARAEQRCLVPFTEFSEPKAAGDRRDPTDTAWWFRVEDQQIPCFAGIWKIDEDHGPVFSFLTTEPNPLVAPKHPKAMPVILLKDDHNRWLHGTHEEALVLQSAYPSQLMAVA